MFGPPLGLATRPVGRSYYRNGGAAVWALATIRPGVPANSGLRAAADPLSISQVDLRRLDVSAELPVLLLLLGMGQVVEGGSLLELQKAIEGFVAPSSQEKCHRRS